MRYRDFSNFLSSFYRNSRANEKGGESFIWALAIILLLASVFLNISISREQARARDEREQLNVLRGKLVLDIPAPTAPAPEIRGPGGVHFVRLTRTAEDLQALSIKNGVSLSEVAYSPASPGPDKSIGQVSIRAHMKGAFGPTKKVIAGILASHPELSLSSILMRRARSTDATLDVDLQFSFFYRIQS